MLVILSKIIYLQNKHIHVNNRISYLQLLLSYLQLSLSNQEKNKILTPQLKDSHLYTLSPFFIYNPILKLLT